jgi:serine/threonine protein phosphatase 1
MSTVAVGDVHGNYPALASLLQRLEPELTRDDTLVFLGDYIDRGPFSRECVERIVELRRKAPFRVVALLGNHEAWMISTMRDHTRHSWLLNVEALDTVASYSRPAAELLRREMEVQGVRLIMERSQLPYEAFFASLPSSHLEFFDTLVPFFRAPEVICVHAGLDPDVPSLEEQDSRNLVWGCPSFPERYGGPLPVVYGHWGNYQLDERRWPRPRERNGTYGIDSIKTGVLTAMRFPDRAVIQSERYLLPASNWS